MESISLVSIVVSIYNAGQFLQEAIESILSQTYSRWELFLVDDGSIDHSPQIAQEYTKKHPEKIFYLEHPNHQNCGVCSTRNLGVAHAKGKYVAFLDSDDVWLPHKLAYQVDIMETYPEIGMVFSMSRYWSTWDPNVVRSSQDYIPNPGLKTNTLYSPGELTIICYPLGNAQAPCPSNILLRRNIFDTIGGFEEGFQKGYQLYEDQAFLSKVYLATSVYVASECLDYYRLHQKSCMATTKNYLEIRLFFLKWFESYLNSKQIDDKKIWQALETAKWPYKYPRLYYLLMLPKKIYLRLKNCLKKVLFQLWVAPSLGSVSGP
ncbi:glycosyltransferase family 2 protein [Trichothermofontia sp.]